MNMLEHKGYYGTVEYSAEDNLLFGKVVGINGLISYDGESINDLKQCFMESIDDYFICCEEESRKPMKSHKRGV